jgi:cytoskeletal protein CcmA (bactofilin family)
MFGRRNPDQSPTSVPPAPPVEAEAENDIDLDLMPDLPPIPVEIQAEPVAEITPEPPSDPVWHASVLPIPAQPAWEAHVAMPVSPPQPAPWQPPAPETISVSIDPQQATQRMLVDDPAPIEAVATVSDTPPAPVPTPAPVATPAPATPERAPVEQPARTKQVSESVIGPDDFFDGRYRSERGVRIQGNARGSIESRQYIFVEAGAEVEADLSAEDITVAGSFNGKIECRRRLEITKTGRVQGHVTTALLIVEEGGLIDGELHMQGDVPQSEQE